jgi:hypothetical protein
VHFSLHDLEYRLISRARSGCGQEVAHRGDSVAIPADHFANVRTPHVDFEDQLAPLLHSGHQHLIGCVNQLPNNKLEETFHVTLPLHPSGWDEPHLTEASPQSFLLRLPPSPPSFSLFELCSRLSRLAGRRSSSNTPPVRG